MAQVVEHPPSKCKVLSSTSSTEEGRKEGRREGGKEGRKEFLLNRAN
jgi:hypothetical protein